MIEEIAILRPRLPFVSLENWETNGRHFTKTGDKKNLAPLKYKGLLPYFQIRPGYHWRLGMSIMLLFSIYEILNYLQNNPCRCA